MYNWGIKLHRFKYISIYILNSDYYTFIGYEFDVGIHYIGEVGPNRLNRTLVEQISDGQIQWNKMENVYDIGNTIHKF